jgi:hypothetical protein
MATSLQVRFGHEENFSRHLLESGQFEELLNRVGLRVTGEGALEVPVRHGHEGRSGRLDIHQPTTAGVVIGEIQYGTSDSNHCNRFAGYAKSFASPVAIVWVAEGFREKDLIAVASSKVPVICVQVKASAAGELKLTVLGGARLSVLSLDKRVARANARAEALLQGAPILAAIKDYIDEIVDSQKCCDFDIDSPDCWQWSMTTEQVVSHVLETSSPALKPLLAKTWSAHYKRLWEVEASGYFVGWKKAIVEQAESLWVQAKPRAKQARLEYLSETAAWRKPMCA